MGFFIKNKICGKGKEYYKNGKLKYIGSFDKGLYQGKGTLYDEKENPRFEGKWDKGKKNGQFKVMDENGTMQIINYRDDIEIKKQK